MDQQKIQNITHFLQAVTDNYGPTATEENARDFSRETKKYGGITVEDVMEYYGDNWKKSFWRFCNNGKLVPRQIIKANAPTKPYVKPSRTPPFTNPPGDKPRRSKGRVAFRSDKEVIDLAVQICKRHNIPRISNLEQFCKRYRSEGIPSYRAICDRLKSADCFTEEVNRILTGAYATEHN